MAKPTDRSALLELGGQRYFDHVEGSDDDELGFRLATERFVPGDMFQSSLKGAGILTENVGRAPLRNGRVVSNMAKNFVF